MNFITGLFQHIYLALTLRHNGTGLPAQFTPSMFVLLAAAFGLALARHSGLHGMPPLMVIAGFGTLLGFLMLLFSSRLHRVVLYLLISIGVDAMLIALELAGHTSLAQGNLQHWEVVAVTIGWVRSIQHDSHQLQQSTKGG